MVTVVKNRALLPLWLLVLRMIAERSRTDLEFAARCGGILAGVMPSHRGMSPDLAVKTMLQPPEAWSFGGRLADALPSAVALELFHNAFLVHDDIEDESIHRRGASTIHEKYGVAIAINVGDALSVLTMTPLLQDLEVMGLQRWSLSGSRTGPGISLIARSGSPVMSVSALSRSSLKTGPRGLVIFQRNMKQLPNSPDKQFIERTINYVIRRDI